MQRNVRLPQDVFIHIAMNLDYHDLINLCEKDEYLICNNPSFWEQKINHDGITIGMNDNLSPYEYKKIYNSWHKAKNDIIHFKQFAQNNGLHSIYANFADLNKIIPFLPQGLINKIGVVNKRLSKVTIKFWQDQNIDMLIFNGTTIKDNLTDKELQYFLANVYYYYPDIQWNG